MCKFLLSGVDGAALGSSQSYLILKVMGPQHCSDGKHPNGMIKYFRALHNNK
jgi:hypothetical protein